MEDTREFTIAVLKDLIQSCIEEQSLFNRASKKISDPKLLLTISNNSKEKANYISKLEREIKRLGGSLSYQDNMEKNFNNSNDTIADYDDDRILLECVNKDVMTLNMYSNAIKEEILWEVIPLVAKQYFESQSMHESLMRSFDKFQRTQFNIA